MKFDLSVKTVRFRSTCTSYLEYGTMVKVVTGRASLECAEGDSGPRTGGKVACTINICAESFLLVGSGDDRPRRPTIYSPTVAGVELERNPCTSEVDALVDCHRVRPYWAELHAHIRDLTTAQFGFVYNKLIRRWDSECELFYDDILHVLQSTVDVRFTTDQKHQVTITKVKRHLNDKLQVSNGEIHFTSDGGVPLGRCP